MGVKKTWVNSGLLNNAFAFADFSLSNSDCWHLKVPSSHYSQPSTQCCMHAADLLFILTKDDVLLGSFLKCSKSKSLVRV